MTENKTTISISDFVKEYKEITNEGQRKHYIKQHIKRTYCPLLQKLNILKLMNDKSVIDNETGKYIDMTVSKLNTISAILILYTDIRPDKDENDNPKTWETYDLLKSTKLIDRILEFIGDDINELMLVQKEVMDTWHMQNVSTYAFMRDLLIKASNNFGVVAGTGMQELSSILDNDDKLHKAMTTIEKFIKKNRK